MRTSIFLFAALLTTACSSGPRGSDDELLDAYEAGLADISALTDALLSDVEATVDLSAIGQHESQYQTDMGAVMEEMEHTLEDLSMCEMMDHEMGGDLEDSEASLQSIQDSMDAMLQAHEAHTDAAECHADAEAHHALVGEEVGVMEGHHHSWEEMEMGCQAHDGM